MPDTRKKLDELVTSVRKERDQLKLQIHLVSLDAKDEYERLSKKCDQLANEYKPVTDAFEQTAENGVSALGMVMNEPIVDFSVYVRQFATQKI